MVIWLIGPPHKPYAIKRCLSSEAGDKIVDVREVFKVAAELFADKMCLYIFLYVSENSNAPFVARKYLPLGISNDSDHLPNRIKSFLQITIAQFTRDLFYLIIIVPDKCHQAWQIPGLL